MAPKIKFPTTQSQRQRRCWLVSWVTNFALCIGLFSVTNASAAELGRHGAPTHFDFDTVCQVAESKLTKPFSRVVVDLPCELIGLDYDSWRYIAYEPNETIWRKGDYPFQVETGHRGYLFTQRVELNEVVNGKSETLPFNPHSFSYRDWLTGYRFPRTLGHSGWKLLAKYNDERRIAEKKNQEVFVREIASFLGASYFRVLGSQHVYGSSMRGLAVDCAMPQPEEFPSFTEYWLQSPEANSKTFRAWAILESERVVGAYQFDFNPDRETTIDVRTKLFVRGKIEKLGIAPLTSMWMWGSGTPPPAKDPRSEVHDADGLMIIGSDDSRLWRPLSRPSVPIVNHYSVPGLKAFGLMQRNRNPKSYNDSEAYYHRRPSIMIEPKETWPAGGIELLRLPAEHEGIDNVGAFYLLKDPPQDGETVELEYRIHICDDDKSIEWKRGDLRDASALPKARFIQSTITQPEPNLWRVKLIAESNGSLFEQVDGSELKPEMISLWTETGRTSAQMVTRDADGVHVQFEVQTEKKEAFELLLRLTDGKRDLSEVWSYRCEP